MNGIVERGSNGYVSDLAFTGVCEQSCCIVYFFISGSCFLRVVFRHPTRFFAVDLVHQWGNNGALAASAI